MQNPIRIKSSLSLLRCSPFSSVVAAGTHVFTFLLLGDQNAGKSTFLHSFRHDRLPPSLAADPPQFRANCFGFQTQFFARALSSAPFVATQTTKISCNLVHFFRLYLPCSSIRDSYQRRDPRSHEVYALIVYRVCKLPASTHASECDSCGALALLFRARARYLWMNCRTWTRTSAARRF